MKPKRQSDERTVLSFRIDLQLLDGLTRLFERDGISQSESIRRAIAAWLDAKGIPVTSAGAKRKGTRGSKR